MKKILILALAIFLLAACASTPKVDLSGEWKLISYGDAASPTPALPGVETSIKFENGQMTGNVGCNGFGGEYELKGDTLTFGPVMSTLMFCEATSDQEQGVLSLFAEGKALTLQMNGDALTIISADGSSVVNLVRK
ncbi:MAG: META domain-containing protein [Chloroflexota bacterium]